MKKSEQPQSLRKSKAAQLAAASTFAIDFLQRGQIIVTDGLKLLFRQNISLLFSFRHRQRDQGGREKQAAAVEQGVSLVADFVAEGADHAEGDGADGGCDPAD